VDEARIELHPADLRMFEVQSGELVKVSSRRGEIVLRALASDEVRRGQAFVAMHWGRNVLNSAGVNELMAGDFDPFSKQPELKHAAVRIDKVALPFQLLLMRVETGERAATELAEALVPWLARFAYASLALAGRDEAAVVLRVAHDQPIPPAWLDELDALVALEGDAALTYSDARRGVSKRALIEDDRLVGLRLCGETVAGAWLRDVMVERQSTTELRRWLLAPLAAPPAAACGRGRIICNCLNVAETDIRAAIADGEGFDAMQQRLKCGTSCGSCVPEIRRMLIAEGA
jgi:assimilatory nitrate reductase catalytic subunit